MIGKLFKHVLDRRAEERRATLYRNLLRHEAKIGGQLFGDVRPGGRREFFCLDEHTWVWHEEWADKNGHRKACTTRYDVRPNSIVKSQNGQYHSVSKEEATHLVRAADLYYQRIRNDIYSFVS